MLEKDVSYRAPEIAPIGGETVFMVGIYISFLRCLDIVQCDGGVFVVVKGWEQAGLDTDVQVLHCWRVQAEILSAQGAYSDKFHLALKYIDEHWKFVKPGFAKEFAPAVYPVIVRKFTTILQAFIFKHIRLQVLRVGIHSAEFVDTDHVAVVSYTVEFHERTASRIVVPDGGAELATKDVILAVMETFVYHFESCSIHTSKEFYPVIGPIPSLCYQEIKPFSQP